MSYPISTLEKLLKGCSGAWDDISTQTLEKFGRGPPVRVGSRSPTEIKKKFGRDCLSQEVKIQGCVRGGSRPPTKIKKKFGRGWPVRL